MEVERLRLWRLNEETSDSMQDELMACSHEPYYNASAPDVLHIIVTLSGYRNSSVIKLVRGNGSFSVQAGDQNTY